MWFGAFCVANEATYSERAKHLSNLGLPWFDRQWAKGRHNGAALWRSLQTQGFRGSLRVVTEWATRRRRAEKVDADTLHRLPSARTIARMLTIGRDDLSKSETVTVAAVETGVPSLVEAREIVEGFHAMIRRQAEADLDPWIERARVSLVASFASGIVKDIAAVRAAIVSHWSNGQTEGQIIKLKLVKRQMYGRGKLDLLQARLIGALPRATSNLRQSPVWMPIDNRWQRLIGICQPVIPYLE